MTLELATEIAYDALIIWAITAFVVVSIAFYINNKKYREDK